MHWFMRNGGGFKSPVWGLIIFGKSAFFIRAWSDDGVATPTSYILFDAEKISRYVRATAVKIIFRVMPRSAEVTM